MRALVILLVLSCRAAEATEHPGAQFLGWERFENFSVTKTTDGWVMDSPRVETDVEWDELVLSWNYRGEPEDGMEVEVMAIYPERATRWFHLGKWALVPNVHPRESVNGQKDDDARVETDVLKLKEPARAMRFRIILRGAAGVDGLKFVGLAFCNSSAQRESLAPKSNLWGTGLEVPERTQADYPEGISEWCSPTCLSMVMSYWAGKLKRPDLNYDVPEAARSVNDPNWPGTGNWPFNTAFAGAHAGIRGYVARFSDISELEEWIAAGVPVVISVRYGVLKGQEERGNGHLVVCIGFDEKGNVLVNDPGRRQVHQVYLRQNLEKAWAESRNTVYLVYPEDWPVPRDRFGHWFTRPQSDRK